MRPLSHPPLEEIRVESIMHALSDPIRVAIFSRIVASDCARNCTAFATIDEKNVPKSTLSQHFKVLREAGLIRSERRGVELDNVSRCAELDERFPGLIAAIIDAHDRQLNRYGRKAPPKRSRAEVAPATRLRRAAG